MILALQKSTQRWFYFEFVLIIDAVMINSPILVLLAVKSIVALMPVYGQVPPPQTASPSIHEKVSSFERAAGVSAPRYSLPSIMANIKSVDPAAATEAWLAMVPRVQR